MTGPTLAPPHLSPPKPAGHAPAARKAARHEAQPNPGLAVLTYLRLHWLLILFCGGLIGAPAAYAAWTLLPGKYGSYALLHVQSNPFAIAGGDPGRSGITAFDTYIKTQRQLITTEFVLNSALNDPAYGVSKLPTLADQQNPIKYLEERLVVDVTGSEVLKISLDGDRPDDVRKIVDAVKAAYLRECVEKEVKQRAAAKAQVDDWKVRMEKLLTHRLGPTAPAAFPGDVVDPAVVQAGGQAPAVAAGIRALGDSTAVKQVLFGSASQRLMRLKQEQIDLPQRLADLMAEGNEFAGLIAEVEKTEAPPEFLKALDNDPEIRDRKSVAVALRDDAARRARILQAGAASDAVRQRLEQADQMDAEARKLRDEKLEASFGRARKARAADLTEKLRQTRKKFDGLRQREKALPALIAAAERELAENLPPEVQQASAKGPPVDVNLTDLITQNGVYGRLSQLALQMDFDLTAPPRVREIQSASTPSLKDSKKQVTATVAAGLLGFALVGAGVVAAEVRAKRVCSLAEMTAASPAPVVGVIPAVPATADPAARAAAAEAMDKLRSRVAQAYLARGATTIAVTSPLADEGKALTAFGLAGSLALAGFKTLLLDFDLRTPALHRHVGVPNQDGVCELLTGAVDHRRAMIVLASGLHFVPAGAFSEEARAAAVGDRLAGLIAALAQPFDCVVLHGHALLAAAEAVEVARRADAVLVCGAYRDTRLPLLKRAVDRLAVMEVPHVGIVYLGATTHEALC